MQAARTQGKAISIVAVGPAHAAAMAAIHGEAFPPGERWEAGAIGSLLATPGCFALLAAAGGMAMARVAGDEADLLTLAVLPAAQGRGLGGLLLSAALAEAARRGAAAVLLEVAPANRAALTLYRRAGFREIGLRRSYYPGGGDALVLRRDEGPENPTRA